MYHFETHCAWKRLATWITNLFTVVLRVLSVDARVYLGNDVKWVVPFTIQEIFSDRWYFSLEDCKQYINKEYYLGVPYVYSEKMKKYFLVLLVKRQDYLTCSLRHAQKHMKTLLGKWNMIRWVACTVLAAWYEHFLISFFFMCNIWAGSSFVTLRKTYGDVLQR